VESENPSGAGNQQERPLTAEWVVGFVDGEGCFSVPIFRNATCRLGWQAQPEFAVVQGERTVNVVHGLQTFFGCGSVTVNRRHDNHRQDVWRFGVRRLDDLVSCIVPFFEQYPLRTAKAGDFASFAEAVRLMDKGVHLRMEGLRQVAAIVSAINRRKPSQFMESSEAIRQPPDIDVPGEDMVLASWRHEEL
jgi:hypothetical protein